MSQVVAFVPPRTDCALRYGQRLSEWYQLWRKHPDEYAKGEQYESDTGHTFRSPGRDSWPAPLVQLRIRFERGDRPDGVEDERQMCLVCEL